MAEFYNTRMIWYLQENYLLYLEYLDPGSGLDIIFPKTKAYTSPIYIGDSYEPQNARYVNSTSSGAFPTKVYYTAIGNETNFVVSELIARQVIAAFRSGLNKAITSTPTSNTEYLQINNGTVTLPTGDITIAGEVFTFIYK